MAICCVRGFADVSLDAIGSVKTIHRANLYEGIANTNVQLFPDGAAGSMGASRLIQIGSRLGRFANAHHHSGY
jgi:hypothetical protein